MRGFNHWVPALLILLLASALAAAPVVANPADTAVEAVNTLGLGLLHKADATNANFVVSPYSIQSALAMTYAGAAGVTRDEMARALHYSTNDIELQRSFAVLRNELNASVLIAAKWPSAIPVKEPVALTVANRLFGQSGYEFRDPFLRLVKGTYDAPLETVDFIGNPAGATKRINDWVGEQTREHIREAIAGGTLDSAVRLVLVNALYFKAPWEAPFDPSATTPGGFHFGDGTTVDVPMMTQEHDLRYCAGDGFGVLELPYAGGEFRLMIFLPDKVGGLAALEARLSPVAIAGQIRWEERRVTVQMPKFKLEPTRMELSGLLQALGMRSAFGPGANFSRMTPADDVGIFGVYHETFVNLDEKGTEAAAATEVVTGTGLPEPRKPLEFRVNHPFLFVIQHRPSGACLFLGRVADPR